MAAAGGKPPNLTGPARGPESSGSDWPAQATDTIVDLVGQVRDKTTGPVLTAARGAVFGVLIAVLVALGLTSLVIALVRLTQIGLEAAAEAAGREISRATAVWLSYLIVGCLFVAVGAVLWRLANRKAVEQIGSAPRGTR